MDNVPTKQCTITQINTCNGFYCNEFNPNSKSSPKMWTENWTGWFKAWDKPDPHRLAEDVAYSAACFFQSNGTFQNYYMYHGGTNFGRTIGGPYITTTYDYDAPLDEYGNIRPPKYGHLKQLHQALKSMEQALLYGQVEWTDEGNGLSVTNFSGEGITPGCFLTKKNTTVDASFTIGNKKHHVPAWSISVLPDCITEVYNTAKVSVQSTQMVKKRAENQPAKLTWSWRPKSLRHPLQGLGGSFTANRLQEQIVTTADASDYCQDYRLLTWCEAELGEDI